jgi:hypothetical protein
MSGHADPERIRVFGVPGARGTALRRSRRRSDPLFSII